MMDEMQRLRDRVEELEGMLGLGRDHVAELMVRLRLLDPEAKFLGLLLRREFVSRDGAYAAIWGGRTESDQPDIRGLDVYSCRLRKVLRKLDVEMVTVRSRGWFIPREQKEKLAALLAPQGGGECE
jgi:DNA-binding winged helix-turn-helix (wHTH) protein